MAVVEGLKIDISGRELAKLARETAGKCEQRAVDLEAQAAHHAKGKEHQKEDHQRETASSAPGNDVMASSLPEGFAELHNGPLFKMVEPTKRAATRECVHLMMAKQFSEQLRDRAKNLRFMADHWPARNTYRLSHSEYHAVLEVPFEHVSIPEE